MLIIKQEFDDRVVEIDRYFHLLESVIEKEAQLIFPNNDDVREEFSLDLQGTLKSNAILLLYNIVESSVSKCLELIHIRISQDRLVYESVSDDIQKIWIHQFYEKFKETGNNDKNVLTNLKLMIDTLITNNVAVELVYRDKEKRSSEIAGNLDAKKIRELAERYGITFDKTSEKLKVIKDKRIHLAYGSESFLECCNSMTFEDLRLMKTEAINFLRDFMSSVEDYVNSRRYQRVNTN